MGLLAVILAAGLQAAYIFIGPNFETVVAQRCYRAAQPTADQLAIWTRDFGLRTVINLRGDNPRFDWYHDEVRTAQAHGLTLLNIATSGQLQPKPETLRQLVDALDRAAEPILLHCRSGIDRTGLAAACYLLLKTDGTLEDAVGQLHWQYGYFPVGKAAAPQRVVLQYRDWLQREKRSHAPEVFRRWVNEGYEKQDEPRLPEWARMGLEAHSVLQRTPCASRFDVILGTEPRWP